MNPLNLKPKTPITPRVSLPGVDQERVDDLQDRLRHATRTRRGYLLAMIRSGKPIYGGTVPGAEKARRRARGKRAKAARKVARAAA